MARVDDERRLDLSFAREVVALASTPARRTISVEKTPIYDGRAVDYRVVQRVPWSTARVIAEVRVSSGQFFGTPSFSLDKGKGGSEQLSIHTNNKHTALVRRALGR